MNAQTVKPATITPGSWEAVVHTRDLTGREAWQVFRRVPLTAEQRASIEQDGDVVRDEEFTADVIATFDGPNAAADAVLAAAAPHMLAALLECEWAGETDAEEGGYVECCPLCGAERRNGQHFETCQLQSALRKAGAR